MSQVRILPGVLWATFARHEETTPPDCRSARCRDSTWQLSRRALLMWWRLLLGVTAGLVVTYLLLVALLLVAYRNNRNTSNEETGEYGWEDIVNPASGTAT